MPWPSWNNSRKTPATPSSGPCWPACRSGPGCRVTISPGGCAAWCEPSAAATWGVDNGKTVQFRASGGRGNVLCDHIT